jgi:dTDP-4-amino-4,6-dideoxygalactose transaminase
MFSQSHTTNNSGDRRLAIDGGSPVRSNPMPVRLAFGSAEQTMIAEALDYYNTRALDPGYQGPFEQRYCDTFCELMGGGYADVVSSGTAALYIALAALNLPKGSEVLVSPITDPGSISPIILNGLIPRLVDSRAGSYNIGIKEIEPRITKKTSCILVVHSVGQAAEIDAIVEMANTYGFKVLEDCSQAHGALWKNQRVGTFGDIAAFSTMYRKASITGSTGGVIFTKNVDIYQQAVAHADRGKPRWRKDFDDRNPAQYLFPALNFNSDEISCAIGIASIQRLDETRRRRIEYITQVSDLINKYSKVCLPYGCIDNDSPFIYPIIVNQEAIRVDKKTFSRAIIAEGIDLNPHYHYLVADWPWVRPYLSDDFDTPNARNIRDKTFNLYLNENYRKQEVLDTIESITKVENAYLK